MQLKAAALFLSSLGAVDAAPVALEARFKDRIYAKLTDSVERATEHLSNRLVMGDVGVFGGYELDLQGETAAWSHECAGIDATRDSMENCAVRQLQALAALCHVEGFVDRSEAGKATALSHLKALTAKEVKSLGLHRMPVDGTEVWVHRRRPTSNQDDVDASPSLQSTALMAMAVCANATGQRQYFEEAEGWFMGLLKLFPQRLWAESKTSFHSFGIVWESLSLVSTHIPRDSSFYDNLQEYIAKLETFLWAKWKETPDAWSFATARALAIRARSKALKTQKARAHVKKWAKEHVSRFLHGDNKAATLSGDAAAASVEASILERLGGGGGYTCGPLQGLTSLATVAQDAQLVQVMLQLLEKDVDRFQLGPGKPLEGLEDQAPVSGAFFRDAEQLKLERRQSIRVDDPAQCVVALAQALRTLEGIRGVEIDGDVVAEEATPDGEEDGKEEL